MTAEGLVIVDLRRVEDKCGADKLSAFQQYVFSTARPGVRYKVISRDADTWYALKSLAGDYGFEVLHEGRDEEEGYYYVIITLKA